MRTSPVKNYCPSHDGLAATGLRLVASLRGPVPLLIGAALIGLGIGAATPLGFAALANAAPSGRLGQTMGAGEVGRQLGDAGGPIVVGALSFLGLATGISGLAAIVGAAALITGIAGRLDSRRATAGR